MTNQNNCNLPAGGLPGHFPENAGAERNRTKLIEPGKWSNEFDENGSFLAAVYDDSYYRILGYEPGELEIREFSDWTKRIHPDDVERVIAYSQDVCARHPEGMDYDIELRMMTKRGYRWFHDFGHCTRRPDGSLARCDGVVFDIQEGFDKWDVIEHEQLRSEVLSYMIEHDDDPIELLKTFAERIRVLIDCDQVIYRDLEETRIMVNSPAIEKTWSVPIEYCRQCEHFDAHHPMYAGGYTEMDNCQEGWQGIPVYQDCPIKSSLTRIVYCDQKVAGYLAIHYVQKYHAFTDQERKTVEEFTRILSLSLSRYQAKKENRELRLREERQAREKEQREKEITQQTLNEVLKDDAVFLVDCVRDTRRTIHNSLSGADDYEDTEHYSASFGRYVETCVSEPDAAIMRAFATPSVIPEILGDRRELKIQYRDTTTGLQRFYEMKIIRFSETEVLQSFREIDADMVNSLLFDRLKENYFALFCIDLESGLIRSFKEDPLNIIGGEGNVTELSSAMHTLAERFEGETRAFFERNSSVPYIREKFAKEDKAEFIYRSALGDGTKWAAVTGIVLQRNEDGSPSLFCLTFGFLDEAAAELQDMYERLDHDAQRLDLFFDTFKAGKWIFEIGSDDEILSSYFSEKLIDDAGSGEHSEEPMGWTGGIWPEDRKQVLEQFSAAVQDHSGKTKLDVTFRVTDRDGKTRWTKSAGKVIRRGDGTGEFFGMNIDITDEVEEQEKYQAQKALAEQFINSFVKDYDIVYKVSAADDSCTLLKASGDMAGSDLDSGRFSDAMNFMLEELVFEPDRDRLRRELTAENVRRRLADTSTFSLEYRVLLDGVTRWDEMTVSALDEATIAVGFVLKNNGIILRHLQEREYENYYALFSIDLDTAQITMIKNDSRYATGTVGSTAPYGAVMQQFAHTLEGEASEFFLQMSDIEKVKAHHALEDKLTYVYQSVLDDEKRWIRATAYVVIRHEDGTPAVVTLGFNFMDSMSTGRQEMAEALARMTAVANYFVKSYSSAFYCDLRNGSAVVLHANPALADRFAEGGLSFERLRADFVNEIVHPEDRENVKRSLDAANILSELEAADDFSFTFRTVSGYAPGIYRGTVIRGADEQHIGVGFRNVTEETQREQELQRIDSLVRTFAGEYEAVFMVSLTDGSYRTVSTVREISDIFSGGDSFAAAMDRYSEQMIHPLDRERTIRERIPFEQIEQRLPVGEMHSIEYRSRTEDGYAWYRGTVNRISEDALMVGFRDCNEEKIFRTIEDKIIGEFDALYMVTLERDEIRPVRASRISRVGSFTGKTVYSRLCREFAETVAPQYREDWIRFSDIGYMKRYLADADRREYIYELPESGKSMRRFTADVVERVNGEASRLLLSFTGIDDQRAQSILLERKMAEQNAFTQYFLEPYESAYYIGLRDLTWQVYKRTERLDAEYPVYENYLQSLGRFISTEVHPEDREACALLIEPEKLRERLAEQPSFSFHYRRISGPEERIYRCEVIRGADEDHAAFGFRNITEDVMRQVEEAQKLQEALTEAQSANRAKTDFLFNMSHDIRTPLNAIIGFTNMAKKHIGDPERILDCLEKTQQSGNLLLTLINSVLDVSRIEAGHAKLEESVADVRYSFAAIEDTMTQLAAARDIDLTFTFGEIRDPFIYCDLDRCNRIFVNIISNAIKFSHEGGLVSVRCEQTEDRREGSGIYRYTFTDNGIGMSEEFQAHVFDQFSRERTSTVSGIEGSGLGLAVCKSLVELMGGTIECRSKLNEGTVFTVVLPFRLQEGRRYTDPITREEIDSADSETRAPAVFRGRRVLLVEDNELNREIAEELLEEEGLTVEEAEDGAAAVEIIREKGPAYFDFILMDIQMPVMNGYEATVAIRELYPDAKLPIIAVSANAFEEDRKASKAAGMDDHVAKPISVNELFTTLAKYL